MLMPQPLPPQLLPPQPPRPPPPRRWASLTCGVSRSSAATATNPSIAENLNFNMSLPLGLRAAESQNPLFCRTTSAPEYKAIAGPKHQKKLADGKIHEPCRPRALEELTACTHAHISAACYLTSAASVR